MRQWVAVAIVWGLLAGVAGAQTSQSSKLTVGGSELPPDGTTVRLDGLATSGTGNVLFVDTDGDVFERLLGKSDLPGTVGYTDEAETWSLLQTFTSGFQTGDGASNSAPSWSFAADTDTGIWRPGGNRLRIVAGGTNRFDIDGSTITATGTFNVTGAATVSSTLGVTGLATLTAGYAAGASSSIAGNLTLTGTGNVTAAGDVAVNGGDITSSAANLNIGGASSITFTSTPIVAASHTLRSANFTSRTSGWGITYAGFADVRGMYADEFYTKNFIADLETALNGGQIIAKSTVVLSTAFTCPAAGATATMRVRDFPGHANMRVFAVSDWVAVRTMTRADADSDGNIEFSVADCVGQVSAYADQTDDTQTWTFTRGSGGNAGGMASSTVVGAEALVIDYGVSGQGFLVARANDGTEGSQSPYWQTTTWTTAPVAANMVPRTRWGQLNGSYGYSASTYGMAAGNPADVFLSVDDTNGVRMMEGGTNQRAQFALDGSILLGDTASSNANLLLNAGGISLRQGTTALLSMTSAGLAGYDQAGTQRFELSTTNGLVVGNTSGTSPNIWLTAEGVLNLRAGGTTRIQLAASNGALQMYDEVGSRGVYLDSTFGLVLSAGTAAGNPALRLTSSSLQFCNNTWSICSLVFDGTSGDITSTGSIQIGSSGHIRGGATAYSTGTGFWVGNDGGVYKAYIGNGTGSGSNYLTWDGSSLGIAAESAIVTGTLTSGALVTSGNLTNGSASDFRIINSTVDGKISLVAASLDVSTGLSSGTGFSGTKTVHAAGGAGDCTLVYIHGVLTGGTC